MRTKTRFKIACCGVLPLGLCLGRFLPAQAAAPSSSAQAMFQDSTNQLDLTVGKTVLIDCAQPVSRVAVGLGGIAEAAAVSPTEIMVDGRAVGQTSLIIWESHGGRQFYNVTVRPSQDPVNEQLDSVRRELQLDLPGQPVRVSYANGNIFLRGTVQNLIDSQRAVEIASTAGKVVNLLNVVVPPSKPQILLKVRFCSVDLSLETQLGINLFDLGLGNALGGVSTGQYTPPFVESAGAGASTSGGVETASGVATIPQELNIMAFFPGLNAGATIQALEQKGVVEVLAEPNLLAADGKEASFLAGGEYPYPVVQGTSVGGQTAVTIEFKQYGILLNFIPTVTPQGTIRLQVAPQVSELDYTNEVDISGFVVPGITERSVNTEVDLRNRQSFVIGGLLNNEDTQTFEKIPFIGDIPILGKLFQSMVQTKNKTELVVIVTPEIVAPIPAGQPGPQLKYPVPFLPPNSHVPMHNPDTNTAATKTPPSPPVIPVEKLIESMKPETPLVIQSGSGSGSGMGTGMSGSGGTSTGP